jgi:copper chaperone CopZ
MMNRSFLQALVPLVFLMFSIRTEAQIKTAKLTASGLTCSMCSKAIYKALEKLPFVDKIDVDIESSTYLLTFKKEPSVDLDKIKNAVTGAGFSVAGFSFTADFESLKVASEDHLSLWGNTFHFVHINPQTISGDVTLKVIDKGFVPVAERKKYAQYTKMKCYQTGVKENCCPVKSNSNRVYHVTI